MELALKIGYLAFDATRTGATDVNFPLDVVLYRRDSFTIVEQRFEREELWPTSLWWQNRIRQSVEEVPASWIDSIMSKLPPTATAP